MPDDDTMPAPMDSHFDRVAIVDDVTVVVAGFLVGNLLKERFWTRNGWRLAGADPMAINRNANGTLATTR